MRLFNISIALILFCYSCEPYKNENHHYEIAFSSRVNNVLCIFKMDLEKLEPKRITSSDIDCMGPKYSPNGDYIIYNSNGDLYLLDSNGNIENLTKSSCLELDHSISKNGDEIIYLSDQDEINNDHRLEVYSLNVNTYQKKRLTYSKFWAYNPRISPLGTMFSYLSWDSTTKQNSLILQEFVSAKIDTIYNNSYSSDFSPDGNLICHSVVNEGLYITDIYNQETRLLVNEGLYPKFSPIGDKVYYQTDSNSELVIASINIDGTNKIYYDTGQTVAEQFDISSDGEIIVFVKRDGYKIYSIYTIESGGKNLTRLTLGNSPVFKP